MFRQSKKSTTNTNSDLQKIDPFAEELSKTIVSYHRVQNLAWKGVPSCKLIDMQWFVLRFGNIYSSMYWSMMLNKFCRKNGHSTFNYLKTIGNRISLHRIKRKYFKSSTQMLKELGLIFRWSAKMRLSWKCLKDYYLFGIIGIQQVDMFRECAISPCLFLLSFWDSIYPTTLKKSSSIPVLKHSVNKL